MGEVVTGRQGDVQECSNCIDWDSLEIAPIPHNQVPQLAIDWDALVIEHSTTTWLIYAFDGGR